MNDTTAGTDDPTDEDDVVEDDLEDAEPSEPAATQ